jgi:hypothetical protein
MLRSFCDINFDNWPWGEQNCTLSFKSSLHEDILDLAPFIPIGTRNFVNPRVCLSLSERNDGKIKVTRYEVVTLEYSQSNVNMFSFPIILNNNTQCVSHSECLKLVTKTFIVLSLYMNVTVEYVVVKKFCKM